MCMPPFRPGFRPALVPVLLLSLLPLSYAPALRSQDFAFHDVGARAAALGGAFTAQADDLTAVYYNPAGLAFLDGFRIKTSLTFATREITAYSPAADRTYRTAPHELVGRLLPVLAPAQGDQPRRRFLYALQLRFDLAELLERRALLHGRQAPDPHLPRGLGRRAGQGSGPRGRLGLRLDERELGPPSSLRARDLYAPPRGRGHEPSRGQRPRHRFRPRRAVEGLFVASGRGEVPEKRRHRPRRTEYVRFSEQPPIQLRHRSGPLRSLHLGDPAPQQILRPPGHDGAADRAQGDRLRYPPQAPSGGSPSTSTPSGSGGASSGSGQFASVNAAEDLSPAFTPVYQEFYGIVPDYGVAGRRSGPPGFEEAQGRARIPPRQVVRPARRLRPPRELRRDWGRTPLYPDPAFDIYSFGAGYEGPLYSIWDEEKTVSRLSIEFFARYAAAKEAASTLPGLEMSYGARRWVGRRRRRVHILIFVPSHADRSPASPLRRRHLPASCRVRDQPRRPAAPIP
ncbi:MAG: outer membrane protein transport protein [Desulfosudis oleivorans]|nr:outer membrane protein transport protein [Desulfosudis oleivorans]